MEEIIAQKQQLDEDLDTLQDSLNTALSRHSVLRKKMRRQKATSDNALGRLEEEKDELANQITEVRT